jgi:hypothetical protein
MEFQVVKAGVDQFVCELSRPGNCQITPLPLYPFTSLGVYLDIP